MLRLFVLFVLFSRFCLIAAEKVLQTPEDRFENTPYISYDFSKTPKKTKRKHMRDAGYFSQVGEDVILSTVFSKELLEQNVFYVDVGAHHPEIINITNYFYQKGCRGICIEPIKKYHELCCTMRAEDININCAAGHKLGELVLHEVENTSWLSSALSTADPKTLRSLRERGESIKKSYHVPVNTLTKILEEYAPEKNISFIKIDVEGYEKFVLQGLDFKKFRPQVFCIEIVSPKGRVGHHSWGHILLKNNYKLMLFDGLNHYYLDTQLPNFGELLEGFSRAPEVLDTLFKEK